MKSKITQWGRRGRLVLFVTALAAGNSELSAVSNGPPGMINYQGYLVDSSGNPLGSKLVGNNRVSYPTNYSVRFKIYDNQNSDSGVKWEQDQVVTVDNGYFNVYLGEGKAIPASAFNGDGADERFVGITVDMSTQGFSDDSEIAPRLRLLSVPYAMLTNRALTADTLSSGATASGGLSVTGTTALENTTADGTLTVTGATTLKNTTADGTLNVTGATTLKNTTANGTLNVTGTMTANKFVGFGTTPIGGIIMWSNLNGAAEPPGWAICNGQTKNGVKTPNLSGRFIVGIGKTDQAGATTYSMGPSNVGQEKVTLTQAQLPDHTHSGKTNKDGAHTHEGNDYWSVTGWHASNWGIKRTVIGTDHANYNGIQARNSEHQHAFTSNANEPHLKGHAHENRPPFYALAYIMRVQ